MLSNQKSQLTLPKVLPKIFLDNKHVLRFQPASPNIFKLIPIRFWDLYKQNSKLEMEPRDPL